MAYKYQRRRRVVRRVTKKKVTAKKAVKVAVKKQFTKNVKRVINRMAEEKHAAPNLSFNTNVASYNPVSVPPQSTTFPLHPVFSNIIQGTGEGDRIGNKIQVAKFNVKGYLTILPSLSASTNVPLVYVKMIIYKNKGDQNNPDMSRFINIGSADGPPTNTLKDMISKYNTDYYTIFATRTFKLGQSASFSAPPNPTQMASNNDFSYTRFFNIDLTKHCKNVRYSDGIAPATNKAFYMSFLMGYADGSTITANTDVLTITYEANLTYRDL